MPARRIAFCITDLDPGGAERALVEIVTRLDRAEWEPHVYCLGPEAPLADVLRKRGVCVVCLGAKSARDLGIVRRLASDFRKLQPAIVQSFLFHANVASRIAAKWANVPVVVSGLRVAEREKRWHVWLDRWTGAAKHHAVCVSSDVADWAVQQLKLSPARVHVIPNGVDFDRFAHAVPLSREELGLPLESRLLVAVGRLHRQKGFDVLIDAVAPLLGADRKRHLLIAGEGPDRKALTSQVARLGLQNHVHLPGRIEDIPGLLKGADLFVLSSRWEGMPNVLLEALSAGTPVVATSVEGVRDILGREAQSLVVPSASIPHLREAIRLALESPVNHPTAKESLQAIVRERFTLDAVAAAYAGLYRQLDS